MTPAPPSLLWEGCFSAEALTGAPSFPLLAFSQQVPGRTFALYRRKSSSARGVSCLGC